MALAAMPHPGAPLLSGALMLLAAPRPQLVLAQRWKCPHCEVGDAFDEFLKPETVKEDEPHSKVHVLWPSTVEVVPITEDLGGWEPVSFRERLAKEVIRGWNDFRDNIAPSLPKRHQLRHQMEQSHAGALNDAFFHFQKRLFEHQGNLKVALKAGEEPPPTPPPDANSSWPKMQDLPEYSRLRRIVDRLSRRYLVRSGMRPEVAYGLNYSIFNWAAVHKPGEFHGPHTHVGEYHVGVFYAQAGPGAGKLRFGDPRGHSPPFGKAYFHTPRSGDLIFFPSWLSHMATVTAASSDILGDKEEPLRVVFSFNIGPIAGPLPCHYWWSDPTGDMRFTRRSRINPKELGF